MRFEDIVGVSTPDEPGNLEHVRLKFDENRYPYIVSKPIHHSQTIVDDREHIIQIDVRPNKELKSMIFSFCPQVEVLSSSCSTNTKRSILTYLFKEMGIPSTILEFEIAPLVDKVTDSEE